MAGKPRKVTVQSLENAAYFYLQRFASSAENLRRVLMRRVERSARVHGTDVAESAGLVDALVDRFKQSGLLDDTAYAEARAVSLHRQGRPVHVVRRWLYQKGVAEDDVERALNLLVDRVDDADFLAAVHVARRRRLGPFRRSDADPQRRDKELATLARAGFPYFIARRIVDAPTVDALSDGKEA